MNAYEFILQMKDYASSSLRNVANSVGMTSSRVDGLNGSMQTAERTSASMGSSMSGTFKNLIAMAGALLVSYGALETMKGLFFLGVELEQTSTKFEVMLGSAEKAKAMLTELNDYANATPYGNESIIKASETMLGFGLASEKVMGNIKMLGDVSMGNEQKLGSISLAFSQIMATGKLMGQDLLQLIGQGFNPLQVISENTGVSMGELKKQMEKGAISAAMVEEAFNLATSEGGRFYDMSNKMSETAGGKFSTMMGTFKAVLAEVGLAFASWIKPLFDIGVAVANNIIPFGHAIADVIRWILEAKPLLFFLGAVLLTIGASFVIANIGAAAMAVQMGILNGVIWLVTAAQTALNFVMAMNPIGLVIIGIAALIAIVWTLWNRFEGFRGVVMGTWEVLKNFGTAIKNYVLTRFQELLSGLSGVASALKAFFSGDFEKAFEVGKAAAGDLFGVKSKAQLIADGKSAAKTFSEGYNNGVNMKAGEVGIDPVTSKAPDYLKKQERSKVFDALGNAGDDAKDKAKAKGDKIVSGGSRMTHITINIAKLQEDTKIYVDKSEKGIESLGEKVQEMLLRAVNSVNQMQTS